MSFWRDRPVLVTGATGLLGSAVLEELLARGAAPVCLVRDEVPASRAVQQGLLARASVVRGDLVEYETVLRAINEYECDTILHLGAQTVVGTAARQARSTFEANVRGTWQLLDAARACGGLVERVVVASSDKAYGEAERLPYTEETPLRGRFPYDVSKSCADLIAFSYAESYGLPVSVTRCGNLFGPGDLNWNRLVPGTIRSALRGERPIIRSDGRFVRDYFFVRDAALAYLELAERMPDPAATGEAFNFGAEQPLSVLELVEKVLAMADASHLEPRILDEASREILRQHLDCTKARRVLGWKPRFSLEEGLRETIAWYRAWLGAEPS
jgi:CDP-glucose 4,6-dehydratase